MSFIDVDLNKAKGEFYPQGTKERERCYLPFCLDSNPAIFLTGLDENPQQCCQKKLQICIPKSRAHCMDDHRNSNILRLVRVCTLGLELGQGPVDVTGHLVEPPLLRTKFSDSIHSNQSPSTWKRTKMAQSFLMPCENCEQKIAIETSQAGQKIVCSGCKAVIKLGTMREIRALASAEQASGPRPDEPRQTSMSVASRGVFVIAVVLTAIGSIWGLMSMLKGNDMESRLVEHRMDEKKIRQLEMSLAAAPPVEMLKAWENVDVDKVAQWVEHPTLKHKRAIREKRIYSYIGFGMAGIGVLAAIGSMVLGSRKTPDLIR